MRKSYQSPGRMKNSSYYIAPVGDWTHDLPHTVASNMVKVSHALNHSATEAVYLGHNKVTVEMNINITSARDSTTKQYYCLFPLSSLHGSGSTSDRCSDHVLRWWCCSDVALKAVMLNVSNMTHTALLGEIINTCHISIQLVKRFCKFVDLMLTSCNAIVRHFVRRAINSAQSPIGRNIAVIRHRYAICVVDINVKHVHRQYPSSQPEVSGTARCILELLCVSNNETYLPGFTKSEVDTMINALCTC